MMLKLSKRLERIAKCVTEGSRVADIGSDHALVPVFLVSTGRSPFAIAGEINEGPLEAARKQVREAGLESRIDVRQGDGLAVLQAGEADTVTIAGMGGALIRDILEEGRLQGKLVGVRELILQPNVGEDLVRRWLVRNGWYLADEMIMEEDGKTYEILLANRPPDADELNGRLYDPGALPIAERLILPVERLYKMGPRLLRKHDPVWIRKWKSELGKLELICRNLSLSDSEESRLRLVGFRSEINEIMEVLACLPMDKPSFK
ncbi:tRNA (adenine(22)-N(1))-methyltransferase TrmK [Paenibacillus tarimensis]